MLKKRVSYFAASSILFVILLGIAVVYTVFLSRGKITSWLSALQNSQNAQLQNSTLDTISTVNPDDPVTFVAITNSIEPMILPCRFVYLKSCAQKGVMPGLPDTEPQKKNYEDFAQNDVFFWVTNSPGTVWKDYQVILTNEQVDTYFPEYSEDKNTRQVKLPVALVIARVAATSNINARLLLATEEVLRGEAGPLFSPNANPEKPFFDDNAGLVEQFGRVAQELRASESKYLLQKREHKSSLEHITFFDKEYSVSAKVTAEDLALADFFAHHLPNRKAFEKAIKMPAKDENLAKFRINQNENFAAIYALLFKGEPLAAPSLNPSPTP